MVLSFCRPCFSDDHDFNIDSDSFSDDNSDELEPWIDAGISEGAYLHIKTEFVFLDTDGDHRLQLKEFEQGLNQLPEFLGMTKDDVVHLFNEIDMDHNKQVDFAEFMGYMGRRKDRLPLPVQVEPQKQRLEDNMSLLGFQFCTTENKKKGVEGDGNCQFYSLSWQLFGTTSEHHMIRTKIIEHLRGPAGAQVADFYCPEHPSEPETFEAWLSYMSKDKTWGNELTLQAASDVFGLHVHVLNSGRWDPKEKPRRGEVAGHSYGVVQTLAPQGQQQRRAKPIWIAFAALHYSPIDPTPYTPVELLAFSA